jgi:acetyltransferase-like isoleucine patch superfamily enzyme
VGVRIGDRVWLGSNCVVLDGADIGDDVIVSAGSVVSGRIPPNTVVLGNPAKVIFTRRSDVEDFLDAVPADVRPASVVGVGRHTA